MPWESRGGRGRYYTRSTRRGGRVIREYLGVGPAAEQVAAKDARRRAEREAQARAWKDERAQAAVLDAAVQDVAEGAEALARAGLLAAGFHRHAQGDWRKRRA